MFTSLGLCTAILGVFLALPLITLGRQRSANIWLGLFVMGIASLSLADYCAMTDVYERHPQWLGVLDWPVAAIGALYYCYVRSITGLGNGWRQAWHFVPVIALSGALLSLHWSSADNLVSASLAQQRVLSPTVLFTIQLMTAVYALAVLYRLRHYQRCLRDNYSSIKNRDLVWLRWLTAVIILLLIVWVPASLWSGMWDWALFLGRISLFYFVGWFGLRQASVFLATTVVATAVNTTDLPAAEDLVSVNIVVDDIAVAHSTPVSAAKYTRSGMTAATAQLIGERLSKRMLMHRDFLDNDIKLVDLAAHIGTSPQLLSQYLNDSIGQNFFDYINGLRVAEVQRLMCKPGSGEQTLIDMAMAAGFNSKSTFNTAFKKICGMPPSQWRSQHDPTPAPFGQDAKSPMNAQTPACST